MQQALAQLVRAREYAAETSGSIWRFAVEWRLLKAIGLEVTDVRWLVSRHFVVVRWELTVPGSFERSFLESDATRLTPESAFVLTDSGFEFCCTVLRRKQPTEPAALPDRGPTTTQLQPDHTAVVKPTWNKDRRELAFRGKAVKVFRVPAANQELILSAFEEEHWPEFIHDPLPPSPQVDSHQRLQSTIKSLNRRQVNNLLRFRGNGGGTIFWEPST